MALRMPQATPNKKYRSDKTLLAENRPSAHTWCTNVSLCYTEGVCRRALVGLSLVCRHEGGAEIVLTLKDGCVTLPQICMLFSTWCTSKYAERGPVCYTMFGSMYLAAYQVDFTMQVSKWGKCSHLWLQMFHNFKAVVCSFGSDKRETNALLLFCSFRVHKKCQNETSLFFCLTASDAKRARSEIAVSIISWDYNWTSIVYKIPTGCYIKRRKGSV